MFRGAQPRQQYKYNLTTAPTAVWKTDPRARMVAQLGHGHNDIITYDDPTAISNWTGDTPHARALSNLVVYKNHVCRSTIRMPRS